MIQPSKSATYGRIVTRHACACATLFKKLNKDSNLYFMFSFKFEFGYRLQYSN